MIFSAHQHRTIAQILIEKSRRSSDPSVKLELLKMAEQHMGLAKYWIKTRTATK
jgi:hypothetical protein